MADREPGSEPSLELPKLGLRRRRRAAPPVEPPVEEVVVDEVAVVDAPPPAPAPPAPTPVVEHVPAPDGTDTVLDTAVDPEPRRRSIDIHIRRPGGMLAAVVTGVVVGLGIVGLTWASLQGCESVQGTSSCGKTGYPLLIVILIVMVVVGALLLRVARVREAGSTSFLAVGLASVLALLFLIDVLDSRWMVVVIPVITAACYAVAHWVTRTFIEPATR